LWFVTRIDPGAIYEVVESFELEKNLVVGNLTIKKDDLVILFDKHIKNPDHFVLYRLRIAKVKSCGSLLISLKIRLIL